MSNEIRLNVFSYENKTLSLLLTNVLETKFLNEIIQYNKYINE